MNYTEKSDTVRLIKALTRASTDEMAEALNTTVNYFNNKLYRNSWSLEDFGKLVTYFGLRMTIQPNGDVIFELSPETKEQIVKAYDELQAKKRAKFLKDIDYEDHWEPEELR